MVYSDPGKIIVVSKIKKLRGVRIAKMDKPAKEEKENVATGKLRILLNILRTASWTRFGKI